MNGFILHTGGADVGLNRALPPDAAAPQPELLPGGATIISWGEAGGDVCVYSDAALGWLILSGYVTGTRSGREFGSELEACRFLFEAIGLCKSDEERKRLLDSIYGSFAMVRYEVGDSFLSCFSDRVGSRPLWIKKSGLGWVISTHAISAGVAGDRSGFDRGGLGAFLLYGGPLDSEQSLFEGVSALSSGTMATLDRVACISKKWYAFQHRPDESRSRSGWVDLVSERLVKASQRLVKRANSPAIFFSGGTDSRLAAAAMKAGGGNPLLVTLSDGPNIETRVATKAAKALGLEHQIITRDKHWYLRTLKNSVFETGGVYMWTHGHFSSAAKVAATRFGVDTFVLGDLCEAFSKLFCDPERTPVNLWTEDEYVKAYDRIRLPLYRPPNRVNTLSLLKREIRDEVEKSLQSKIVEQFGRLRVNANDPLIVGDMAFRWESVALLPTFYMFLDLRSVAADRNMMFDADVHELLEKMPSSIRSGRNLGAAVIRRLSSEAGWVVNSNSLVPMFWHPWFHKTAKKVKPYIGKLRRAVKGSSHRTTGSWQEHAHLFQSDREWRQTAEVQAKKIDNFDAEIFDRDQINSVWRLFLSGDLERAADFEKVLQLSFINDFVAR